MGRFVFLLFLFICSMPLEWARAAQEDFYFQEVTAEAWDRYDQSQKVTFPSHPVEIIDPVALTSEFKRGLKWEAKGLYRKAAKAYLKALSYSPVYPMSAEILWHLAHCYEKQSRWVDAFNIYAKLFKKYPAYELAPEAPQHQFLAAKVLADGKEKIVLSTPTDQFYSSIAIGLFEKLQKQVPDSQLAGVCQFEIGTIYKNKKQFQQASEAFYKVILNYPLHPLIASALFESGLCASRAVRGAHYDAHSMNIVIKRFERFLREFPKDERVAFAQKLLGEIQELQAEKLFQTGEFYLKEQSQKSAQIYFKELLEKYPNSYWAQNVQQTSEGNWVLIQEKKSVSSRPYNFKERLSTFLELFKFSS